MAQAPDAPPQPPPPSVEFIATMVSKGNNEAAILLLAQHVAHLSSIFDGLNATLHSRVSKSEFRRSTAAVCGLLVSIFLLLVSFHLRK